MSALPETIGRFRIDAHLRAGEGGGLYAATDLDTDRRVTLRVFARGNDTWLRQYMERTTLLTQLTHPHVARVLAGGADASRAWWVFDHTDVVALSDMLRGGTPPSIDQRVSMLADVCRAAAYAYARGVTFVDVRTAWLWVTPDGQCLVAGFAPPAGGDLDTGVDSVDWLRYAPPELVLGAPQDARSLVFTAGVVLYEVLTGRRLFDGDRLVDLAQQVLYGKVPRLVVLPDEHGPDRAAAASTTLTPVLTRALAKAPDDRFASLADFADSLDASARRLRDLGGPVDARNADTGEWLLLSDERRAPAAAVPPPASASTPAARARLAPPPPTATSPVYDEHVQFTVYRPRVITPDTWETMLVFAHLDALPADARPGTPDPIEEVQRQARSLLGNTSAYGQQTVDTDQPVPREGFLLVVPHADGVEFNPPTAAFQWLESVHREEFRLRPRPDTVGQTIRGRVTVFLGAIILAEVPLTLRVGAPGLSTVAPPERETARPYRRIFASYSHRDQHVVEEFSRYAEALGDQYLRDVVQLRAGEHWSDALKELIRQADVFQLFWSWNALQSPYVREEWQYALGLQRPSFIRPVYWDEPLPAADGLPPETLRALHFERIRPVSATRPPGEAGLSAPSLSDHDTLGLSLPSLHPPSESSPAAQRTPATRFLRYAGPVVAAIFLVALLLPLRDDVRNAAPTWSESAKDAIESGGTVFSERLPASDTTDNAPATTAPAPAAPAESPPPLEPSPPPASSTGTAQPRPRSGRIPPSSAATKASPVPKASPPLLPPMPSAPADAPVDDVRDTVAPGARRLLVAVLDVAGAPVAQARITLRPAGGTGVTLHATTDARGQATLRLRADTAYTVAISHEGYRSATRPVPRGRSPVTLTVALPVVDRGAASRDASARADGHGTMRNAVSERDVALGCVTATRMT